MVEPDTSTILSSLMVIHSIKLQTLMEYIQEISSSPSITEWLNTVVFQSSVADFSPFVKL